jgi:arylsulfatase A-like enzyme
MPAGGSELYNALERSPFGNDLTEAFVERALEAEQLGRHESVDVLAVSFSSHDYVGHEHGPFSAEEHEVTLRADKMLGKLLEAIDRQVGMENVLVVMSADHGVAPAPGRDTPRGMPGGRIPVNAVRDAIQAALSRKYGDGSWVRGSWDLSIYLDQDLIARKGLVAAEVRRAAAEAALTVPHILRVSTRDQLAAGQVSGDPAARSMMNGFNERRSADIEFLPEPFWILSTTGTTHGTTFGYDTHVPVIFMGAGLRPGRYDESIAVNDIAPTLATLLDVETPSGSVGRVLNEMWGQ